MPSLLAFAVAPLPLTIQKPNPLGLWGTNHQQIARGVMNAPADLKPPSGEQFLADGLPEGIRTLPPSDRGDSAIMHDRIHRSLHADTEFCR